MIEKARDHRNTRLDDGALDELLAAMTMGLQRGLDPPVARLTASDFAEGLALAVADAKQRVAGQ